jgi:hypothetical protein
MARKCSCMDSFCALAVLVIAPYPKYGMVTQDLAVTRPDCRKAP